LHNYSSFNNDDCSYSKPSRMVIVYEHTTSTCRNICRSFLEPKWATWRQI